MNSTAFHAAHANGLPSRFLSLTLAAACVVSVTTSDSLAQFSSRPVAAKDSATAVAVLPGGIPIIGRSDGLIVAINPVNGRSKQDFARHPSSIAEMRVDPRGEYVAASGMDGVVALWPFTVVPKSTGAGIPELRAVGRFKAPEITLEPSPKVWNDSVQVEWTFDGSHLVTWSFDWLHGDSPTAVQVWTRKGELIWTGPHARQVDVHPASNRIAVVMADKVLLGWPGESLHEVDLVGAYDSIEFSPDGDTVAVGGRDFNVWLLDAADGSQRLRRRVPELDGFVNHEFIQRLRWSPDGRWIGVVAAKGLNPGIIDATTLEPHWVGGLLGARMWSVFDVAWTPDGTMVTGFGSTLAVNPTDGELAVLVDGEEWHQMQPLGDDGGFLLLSGGYTRRIAGGTKKELWHRTEMAHGHAKRRAGGAPR